MWTPIFAVGSALAAGAYVSLRYAWWRPAVPDQVPRVLMYHMVSEHRGGARFNKLRVPPAMFRRQVAWLREQQFSFVFASDLFSDRPLPRRAVCLTFDDGYADNLEAADPVLAEFDAVATLYLVADRTGGWSSKKKAHHDDAELQNEPKLSDDQVRTMLKTGRWELGGHTQNHANLLKCGPVEAHDEIVGARQRVEQKFGVRVPTFAYPFGLFNDDHADLAREAGYLGAFTVDPGIAPHPYAHPMCVPRIKVSGKDGMFAFRLRIRGGKRGLWK